MDDRLSSVTQANLHGGCWLWVMEICSAFTVTLCQWLTRHLVHIHLTLLTLVCASLRSLVISISLPPHSLRKRSSSILCCFFCRSCLREPIRLSTSSALCRQPGQNENHHTEPMLELVEALLPYLILPRVGCADTYTDLGHSFTC